MARTSPSGPARPVFLLLAEDPFRARLRLAELVAALSRGEAVPSGTAGDLARVPSTDLGLGLGLARHDARFDDPVDIAMSGRAQGLFDTVDERRIVIVEHAEALHDHAFIADLPETSALVLIVAEQLPSRARRAPARARGAKRGADVPEPAGPSAADLPALVEAAGGRVERIARLAPTEAGAWIRARAALRGLELEPDATGELAMAATIDGERFGGGHVDSERLEQELAKLSAYTGGRRVTAADVSAVVSGAIEADVFALTEAVVKRDRRAAIGRLEKLLAGGQAPQQILALLLWQFRVLLFARALKDDADALRKAKAIRSSPGALRRWAGQARRVSQAQVTRSIESIYATDLAIKQGRISLDRREDAEATALMLCVLDLCGVAGADPRDLVVGEPPKR